MKKTLLVISLYTLLIFLIGCEAIQLTQDPNNPNTGDNQETTSTDNQIPTPNPAPNHTPIPIVEPDNSIDPNPNGGFTFTNCNESSNSNIEKNVYITLIELGDPAQYESKRKTAVNLINQCYTVNISEEYEIQPGELSTQGATFINKKIGNDSIFNVIPFYPRMDVYDYNAFMGTQNITYITDVTAHDVYNYYNGVTAEGYSITENIQDQKITFRNESENTSISVIITNNGIETLVNFDLLMQFDAG